MTPKRRGRPPSGETPIRNVRVPDDIWQAAKDVAATRDETLTEVIVDALRRYVRRHRPDPQAGTSSR